MTNVYVRRLCQWEADDHAMNLIVRESGDRKTISVPEGSTVREALLSCGINPGGTCNGRGECCHCDVFIKDGRGLFYTLACQTPVTDGMEVASVRTRDIGETTRGLAPIWRSDGQGWGYGLAIDVGTTTIVCRLYNQESGKLINTVRRANPQLVFGAAVARRIEACVEGKLKTMAKLLEEVLAEMTGTLASEAGISPSDINDISICGNTAMELIAANVDPTALSVAPYMPPTLFGEEIDYLTLVDSDITAGTAYFAPCISGTIGGDITCGLLAIDMARSNELTLFLDLGTNGEMVLGDKHGILACATTAGSVFEGASIKYGAPAYQGSIYKVRYVDGQLVTSVIGGEEPLGICGSGFMDALAIMLDCNILTPDGTILTAPEATCVSSCGLEKYLCVEDGEPCFRLSEGISITQHDIRVFLHAKAGLSAGVRLMLEKRGVAQDDIRKIVFAGSFADRVTLANASRLGILPPGLQNRTVSVGDAAVEGASALLLSDTANDQIEKIIDICEYIELRDNPEFEALASECMRF